jgi:hypothetical protein
MIAELPDRTAQDKWSKRTGMPGARFEAACNMRSPTDRRSTSPP